MTIESRKDRLETIKQYLAKYPDATLGELGEFLGVSRQRAHVLIQGSGLQTKRWNSLKQSLTDREVEILQWIAKGKDNRAIAELMGLKYKTVKNHTHTIYLKLNASNREQAASEAIRQGLISPNKTTSINLQS